MRNAHGLARAANNSAGAGDLHAAAVLLYQAAEEVGKAKLLKEATQPVATSRGSDFRRDEMTPEERRRVVAVVFAEIHASNEGIARLLPREDWKPYMQTVLRTPVVLDRWVTERKTGVKRAEVITTRLVQDERGSAPARELNRWAGG